MAQIESTITVSVEKLVQDSLKDLAENVHRKYGVQINGARIMWRDLSTHNASTFMVAEVYIELNKEYR